MDDVRQGLTLGVEEELHLVDLESWSMSPSAPQLLAGLPGASFSAEMQRTTVESRTDVSDSLADLRAELLRLRGALDEVAEPAGVALACVGTVPLSSPDDFELSRGGRYRRIQEQYRLLVDEQLICGLQVHVGVSDRDVAVQVSQRVEWILPVLLALSASSPYWNGKDTGYASIRSIIWQRWPSAGPMGPVASAHQYDELMADLLRTGVVADEGMAYFDVRPSSHVPTVELRVCDACPIVDDAVLIAGLFRAAVLQAESELARGKDRRPRAVPVHRAAMWQAARGGLSGYLLDDEPHPEPLPAQVAVRNALRRVRPQLEELGDFEEVSALLEATLARGNSADRQRAAFSERGRIEDVMSLVVRESTGDAAGPLPAIEELRTYRARAGDEAVVANASPRGAYREVITHLRHLEGRELDRRVHAAAEWAEQRGLGFVVDGEPRRFDVDLVPRIINEHEWVDVVAGLSQRGRAIEAFLQDVYADGRVLARQIVPSELIIGSPGWRDEARRLPRGVLRAPLQGFDLVRNEFGDWRVLEDNVRSPSGAMFALAVRDLMDKVMPDLPRPRGLLDPGHAVPMLRQSILGPGGPDGVGAVLTDGDRDAAWFEHRRVAEAARLLLVRADDLDVVDGHVTERGSGRRIDALYLRMDGELTELADGSGRAIGAEIFEAAVAGEVFLANAPGNGVADDKALYCYVPDLIEFYLGETPLLESVPTYRTSDESERAAVLERVGELVTKPVDGEGGVGVLIGPDATAREVAERRELIRQDPTRWIAQEPVALSSHPTLVDGELEPRRVDLRAFACGGPDGDFQVAPVALTRVAARDSMVVNSSRGGGAKDTWLLGPAEPGDTEDEEHGHRGEVVGVVRAGR